MQERLGSIAIKAGRFLLETQDVSKQVVIKEKGDFALDADLQAEELICAFLNREFPELTVVAEERNSNKNLPASFITVDPLDGTIPYSRGMREWGVNIAYVEDRKPKVGVVFLPARDELLTVTVGEGCWLNGKLLSRPNIPSSPRAIISLDLHYATDPGFVERVLPPLSAECLLIRSLGSTAALTVGFAQGQVDAHLNERGGGVWDIASFGAVAAHFGSFASDLSGHELTWESQSTNVLFSHCDNLAARILTIMGCESA